MIRVEEVEARLASHVPALAGRLQQAAEFALAVQNNRLPQVTPAGFVLPGVLAGGVADMAAGVFRQELRDTVIVVLCFRVAGDATMSAGVDESKPVVRSVIEAVCGWAPDDAPGLFTLGKAELVGSQDSVLVWQIDFTMDDQLRIFA